MIAKYKGKCVECGETIVPGQVIRNNGRAWVHSACAAKAPVEERRDIETRWQDQQDDLWEADSIGPRDGLEGCSSVGELMAQDMRRARMGLG